jgi:hypothetical protein
MAMMLWVHLKLNLNGRLLECICFYFHSIFVNYAGLPVRPQSLELIF